jgi:hypothetical protein
MLQTVWKPSLIGLRQCTVAFATTIRVLAPSILQSPVYRPFGRRNPGSDLFHSKPISSFFHVAAEVASIDRSPESIRRHGLQPSAIFHRNEVRRRARKIFSPAPLSPCHYHQVYCFRNRQRIPYNPSRARDGIQRHAPLVRSKILGKNHHALTQRIGEADDLAVVAAALAADRCGWIIRNGPLRR